MSTDDDFKQRLLLDAERGKQAKMILNHPLVKESLIALRAKLVDEFGATTAGDSKERDELWRQMKTVEWFEGQLTRVMQTGQLAEKSLFQAIKSRFVR